METITATELKTRLDAGDDIHLIDVRQPDEHAFASIEGAVLIPMGEILARKGEIDGTRETVVYCRSGVRSARVIEALQGAGFPGKLVNLSGGIIAWAKDVDPTLPQF